MIHWSSIYVLRSVALLLVFVVLLRYFLHWFSYGRRLSGVAEPLPLLEFFHREHRFYARQVLLCFVTLLLSVWSYNLHRPPRKVYDPNQVYEVQIGDRNGSWEIGFSAEEVAVVVALLWGLSRASTIAWQIRLLWAVREQIDFDIHKLRA